MSIKKTIRKLKYIVKDLFIDKDTIRMSWDQGTNFGDAFNPYLIKALTNRNVVWVNRKYYHKPYLMSIGSILQKSTSNALVWGTGFISADSKLNENPKKIYAVRGPRTRNRLIELGYSCPEIYGDPALLIPKIYDPKIEKNYKLGIIPHYVDKDNPNLKNFFDKDILIIDIKQKNHFEFINQLLSCEKIVSSSLHGIIVSDAYKIPSIWVEFSNKVKGDGFKFLDYFESVHRKDKRPYLINSSTKIENLYELFYQYKISIDLDKLIDSFPYKTSKS